MTENYRYKGDDIADRLAGYAGRVLVIVDDLPETMSGRHVADQLLRSGTSVGAHYAEARSAMSRAQFIHKIALGAQEGRESLHWLKSAVFAELWEETPQDLIAEARELVGILAASQRTAQRRKDQ